jgi:hypothetical protein
MTKREALQATINYTIPALVLDKHLADSGLNGTENYTPETDKKAIDLCAAGLILFICTSPNISQGGFSISIGDKEKLLQIRSLILAKWGEHEGSVISDASDLW